MKKLFFAVPVLFIIIAAQSVFAWETWNPSFYVGAGYGLSKVDSGVSGLTGSASLDESDGGFKFFCGFKINQFIGIETGYSNLGEADLSGNNGDMFSMGGATYQFITNGVKISAEATSIQISAIYFIPLDYFTGKESMKYFEPFLKIGANFWDIEYSMSASNVNQVKADDDGTNAVFGAGINFKLNDKIHLRTEWEQYQTEEDINYFSASAIFNF